MTNDASAADQQPAEAGSDAQIHEMVQDPAGYFIRSRQEAKREARRYVATRLGRAKPA